MDIVLNNEDLLTEIFLRLPVKSLIRFQSVCKKWNLLISSDYFSRQHTLRHSKLQQSLILEMDSSELFYFNPTTSHEKKMIPYSLTDPDLRILHACNGLMLLESRHSPCTHDPFRDPINPHKSFYVYNPATKRSRMITLTRSGEYPYVIQINLACDPSFLPYYKVICARSAGRSGTMFCTYLIEVYDSKSHTWKLGLEGFKYLGIYNGVFFNNSMYWSSIAGHCKYDIAHNKMEICPLSENVKYTYLQELDGHLYHFQLVEGMDCDYAALWELGGEKQSKWLPKYYHQITSPFWIDDDILSLVRSDGEGAFLLTYGRGKIGAYNFLVKSYKDVIDLTSQPFYQPHQRLIIRGFRVGKTLALV